MKNKTIPAALERQGLQSVSEQNKESRPMVYDSSQLFSGRNEIQISHEGELYRIRITRNGKLIMNK